MQKKIKIPCFSFASQFFRPLLVAYFDVNYDHQFVKDTQFIRNKIVEVAKKYGTSNLKFAISNEVEFEDEIRSEIKFSYQSTVSVS
jgi:hypothetical protein